MFKDYRRTAALLVGLTLLLPTWSGEAHEIPADVTVQAFVKPEAESLQMIVRVPLASMRDYDFPAREPGYLIISDAEALIQGAAVEWIANYVDMYEGDELLARPIVAAARIAIPGDRAFRSYGNAIENVFSAPLSDEIDLPPPQALLDVVLEWTVTSDESDFSIDARFAQLGIRTITVLRFLPVGGAERAFQYSGNPGLGRLDPRWHQAAWRFVVLGFDHILDGLDHLLFLFCLVVPFRSFWALVPIVTSFTAGHSITLIAAALGLTPQALWFPPLIETLIALSIVYMAFENILGAKLRNRWMIAFSFGLVHGFGFSFALSEVLQFGGSHLLISLVSFNVGVEFGQLFVLALTIPLLEVLFRKVLPEVGGIVVLSALLAHTGWHWMTERGGQLIQYDFSLPTAGVATAATALRWLMLGLIILGTAWLLRLGFERLTGPASPQDET